VHRKLGWGRYSTVWLVQNLQSGKFRALKILSASINHEVSLTYEIEALVTLKASRLKYPNHHGYNYINHFEDYFWFKGENGSHQCIITKVMAEHLGYFAAWFSNREIPRPLVQHFARQLIMALDYAHHCDIAHNDIQHANIMIQLPDDDLEPIINRYLAATKSSISQSLHNYYLNDGVDLMTLTIALIDWGFAIFEGYLPEGMTYHLTFQPPETMLLAPRGLQVDAWNLGMLIPDLIFGEALFGNNLISGEYSFKSHLEEINQLLGPFPKHLLESGKQHQDMFDDRGDIKDPEYGDFLNLQERFSSIEGEEGLKFLDLVLSILQIDPEKRLEMMDLLAHPWM
ncbi:kinase-like domain-containing protein, partial [Bisporella sp. PMI_857]